MNRAVKGALLSILLVVTSAAIAQPSTKSNARSPLAKFGALAIDRADGFYYGWAFNQTSEQEAIRSALDGARKFGAKSPSVVLIWSGSGCAAYRTVEGRVGSAFGWGVASTQEAADQIASREALKRSDGRATNNYVWACNSKSKPLNVLYDAGPEIFPAVTIGDQTFSGIGVKITRFRNGDPIIKAKTPEEYKKLTLSKQPACFCYDEELCEKTGYLYNAYAVFDSRGLAPEGWRIPTKADWQRLIDRLGGEKGAGVKLRRSEGWPSWAIPANNLSGFGSTPAPDFRGEQKNWEAAKPFDYIPHWTSSPVEDDPKYIYVFSHSAYDTYDQVKFGQFFWHSSAYLRLIEEKSD